MQREHKRGIGPTAGGRAVYMTVLCGTHMPCRVRDTNVKSCAGRFMHRRGRSSAAGGERGGPVQWSGRCMQGSGAVNRRMHAYAAASSARRVQGCGLEQNRSGQQVTAGAGRVTGHAAGVLWGCAWLRMLS